MLTAQENKKQKKIAIFVIAYNAETTLKWVLDRIPAEVKKKVSEIFVFDDYSKDKTYDVGVEYKLKSKIKNLNIYRNEKNLGYGGNQKRGYDYAIKQGHDIVVMLHGDGQYAPEVLPSLLKPFDDDRIALVMGSRMLGKPLKGGMPLYKYFGNKFLTFIENAFLGLNITEYHSGYRIYNCHALQKVPYHLCSDNFHFDTDIIIQFKHHNLKIVERPIPTYYGNEICYVNVIQYGLNVLKSILQYKLHLWRIKKIRKFSRK